MILTLKKILQSAKKEFIYGGFLSSFGAMSIVFSVAILLNLVISWQFLVMIFSGTHAVYLYNRFKELSKDKATAPMRTAHLQKYRKKIPLIIIGLSLIFIGLLFYPKKLSVFLFTILLFFSSILYTIFFKKITKKIKSFKTFFVALIWSLLVPLLFVYHSIPFVLPLLLIGLFVYLRLFIHEELLNFQDAPNDKKQGLLTIANTMPKNILSRYLIWVAAGATILIVCGIYFKLLPSFSIALLFTFPYTVYILKKGDRHLSELSRYAFIDGEFILWSVFLMITKLLFDYLII